MILNDPTKPSNNSQINPNDGSTATNTTGVTILSTVSTVSSSPAVTVTSSRSRNTNRDRQQSDDKQENSNVKGKNPPKPKEEFVKDVYQFHEKRSTPIMHVPKITGREVDIHRLYCEVTERGGFQKVNMRDEWDEILPELGLKDKIVNGSAALKYIYRRVLEKYERLNYFGEDPDKADALESAEISEFSRGRGSRYSSSYGSSNPTIIHNVAMTYNYRQHHVNMDRRRQSKLSTDLYKHSPYEKLMLSMLSPLPNEQDFAINACTLMANESKHTLKLNEYPKLLDALLAHTGVFSDYTMRKMFQHIYSGVRHHSLYGFWNDLLNDKPQILDLYTDEQTLREASIIDDYDDGKPETEGIWQDCNDLYFLNLRTGLGTQDHVGQRVLQIVSILRNLSFQDENLAVLTKNKTLLRFLVMSSNIRWSNVHIQALEITGNVAGELEILDPTIDDLSRCLMATLCDGIEGNDRGVIINCLEILYKLCQKESNEDYVLKCLNSNFYNTISMFLSLNDIMLLLFTLEAIYALTSLGPKSCHSIMQVKGIVDQLISLITVKSQAYGSDGCILMRVVETVPGNMLPIVAQNIANLQNVANIQKQTPVITSQNQIKPQILTPNPMPAPEMPEAQAEYVQQQQQQNQQQQQQQNQQQQQIQMPQNFTQDDEQYALAWLGATFERTPNVESHIETQELYRMYLSHCQKSGKHSVVNHIHFPKLVRLIFTSVVGPAAVRKSDGTELSGLHYVSIRMRAQPLPLQKTIITVVGGQASPATKQTESPAAARKSKKKLKQAMEAALAAPPIPSAVSSTSPLSSQATTPNTTPNSTPVVDNSTALCVTDSAKTDINSTEQIIIQPSVQAAGKANLSPPDVDSRTEEKMDIDEKDDVPANLETLAQTQENELMKIADAGLSTHSPMSAQGQNPSTSLIKSLLANKVNQRQQKHNSNSPTTTCQSTLCDSATTTTQPIKVASTAITSLVNNTLMQNTPVKVGQTTIKPLNPHTPISEKKTQISESAPPPLAPLSGANVAKDASGRPIILANQMLVDILDKKMVDPPIPASIIQKRKLEDPVGSSKRLALDSAAGGSSKEEVQVTPSKNAANLYAEMAASILEDEDLEEFSTQLQKPPPSLEQQPLQQTSLILPSKIQHQQPTSAPLPPVQRQLMFQTNQPQIKLTQPGATSNQQIPNAVATIKTDQGLQTVPVILQQKPMEVQQQGQTQILQHMIQQASQLQQTYVVATNKQGQTYLVAQPTQPQPQPPPPQPTQTVLVTQTPQQQSTGQKTIIILQQQPLPGQQQQIITTVPPGQGQKMIMTTSQGQQVLVTQRPQTPQQIFINPQTGTATHIQHMPVQPQSRQILQSSNTQQQQQQNQTQQIQAGQISPSLLNQLNQIPATVKLHQPLAQQNTQTQQSQPATITRMGKTVSLVQPSSVPSTPVVIPQLQQHQSIIQQHIISGPSEKRHVILGNNGGSTGVGMRAIEIKETVITQAQQPPQQCQLNSQTIITTQQTSQGSTGSSKTPPLLQQQVQQQIRAVIEQQQHPSIIQQKISSLPVMQQQQPQTSSSSSQNQVMVQANIAASKHKTPLQQQQQQQTPTQLAAKLPDPTLPLIQSKNINQSQNVATSIPLSTQSVGVGNVKRPLTIVKPSLPTVKLPTIVNTSGPPPLTAVNNQFESTNKEDIEKSSLTQTMTTGPTQASTMAKTLPTQTVQSYTTTATAATSTISATARTATPPPQQNSNQMSVQAQQSSGPSSALLSPQQPVQQTQQLSNIDAQWLYICDWRNCPRKKFKSMGDLQHHVCTLHAPDHLDLGADIFCQWGVGPGLCDGLPRKRFSLMTHLIDHHLTQDSLRNAVQRRIATGMYNIAPAIPPVTIVRNTEIVQKTNNESPTPSVSSASSSQTTTCLSALQAIKRHTDLTNAKELMDENEGPVTKSIRLTASLILRNLVTYTSTAKRSIRRYEPHLANIALSNVESSGTISNILYEMNG